MGWTDTRDALRREVERGNDQWQRARARHPALAGLSTTSDLTTRLVDAGAADWNGRRAIAQALLLAQREAPSSCLSSALVLAFWPLLSNLCGRARSSLDREQIALTSFVLAISECDPARRGPARPTLVFINGVAIGLSIFELAEEVEVRYVGGDGDRYVRVGSPEERALAVLGRPHDWTTRQSLTSGRIAIHAYAPTRAFSWERYWREKKAGDLLKALEAIATELEQQVPATLAAEKKAKEEAEERQRKWEIERRETEKREAERRKVEAEKARLDQLKADVERWRFARDARAFVAELEEIVSSKNLRISRGGPLEEQIEWILARAMDADPHAQLRKDVDEMAAKHRTWMKPEKSPLGTLFRIRRARRCRC